MRTSSTLNRMRDTIVPSPNSPGEVRSSEVILVKEKEISIRRLCPNPSYLGSTTKIMHALSVTVSYYSDFKPK